MIKIKGMTVYAANPTPVIRLDWGENVVLSPSGREYINQDTGEVYEPVYDRGGKLIGFVDGGRYI